MLETGGKGWGWGQESRAREKADMPEITGQLLMPTQAKRQCDGCQYHVNPARPTCFRADPTPARRFYKDFFLGVQ